VAGTSEARAGPVRRTPPDGHPDPPCGHRRRLGRDRAAPPRGAAARVNAWRLTARAYEPALAAPLARAADVRGVRHRAGAGRPRATGRSPGGAPWRSTSAAPAASTPARWPPPARTSTPSTRRARSSLEARRRAAADGVDADAGAGRRPRPAVRRRDLRPRGARRHPERAGRARAGARRDRSRAAARAAAPGSCTSRAGRLGRPLQSLLGLGGLRFPTPETSTPGPPAGLVPIRATSGGARSCWRCTGAARARRRWPRAPGTGWVGPSRHAPTERGAGRVAEAERPPAGRSPAESAVGAVGPRGVAAAHVEDGGHLAQVDGDEVVRLHAGSSASVRAPGPCPRTRAP
jgi:hypothetical protein